MSEAIVTKITAIPHPDPKYTRIQVGIALGNMVIIGKDVQDGDLGIYFDTEAQLSESFCKANQLFKQDGGYIEENRRVKAIRLCGMKSVGIWLPLKCLAYTKYNLKNLREGMTFQDLNKHEIVNRYIPPRIAARLARGGKVPIQIKQFKRHYDTQKFLHVQKFIILPCQYVITEKLHGTSARQARVFTEVEKPLNKFKAWVNKITKRQVFKPVKIKEWRDVLGTRNVVIGNVSPFEHFNSHEKYRSEWANKFKSKLLNGEQIFYEIVGYDENGKKIMPDHRTRSLEKEFIKIWGSKMEYTYSCPPGTSKAYLYRIIITDENGYSHEMPWSHVRRRSAEIGIPLVPILESGVIHSADNAREGIRIMTEVHVNGPSTVDSSHIREGVILRCENLMTEPQVMKYKSFEFLAMESDTKNDEDYFDIEEAS